MGRMKAKRQRKNQPKSQLNNEDRNPRLPFIEHVLELRKRLFYIGLSIVLWAAAAYSIQQHIVALLLKPAHNQQFIYTSVGGGINFLFQVCIYVGIAMSIPVIVFQVLKYIEPLIKKGAMRFILWGSAASGILACAGIAFGYLVGLPAALHFLLHQFTTGQIHPLLTIQSYMSFVTMYICGSALLFQLPLILIIINRIKPLQPKRLLGFERWVILLAFIIGGLMNPSPRIQDQLLLAGPMILAYQVGIFIIWQINKRSSRSSWLTELLNKDMEEQQLRQNKFQAAKTALQQELARQPVQQPVTALAPKDTAPTTLATRPQPRTGRIYVNDFAMRRQVTTRLPGKTPEAAA